jgi:uncharacterized membrane protein
MAETKELKFFERNSPLLPAILLFVNMLIAVLWTIRAFHSPASGMSVAALAAAGALGFAILVIAGYAVLRWFTNGDRRTASSGVSFSSSACSLFLFFLPEYLLGNQVLLIRSLILLFLGVALFGACLWEAMRGMEPAVDAFTNKLSRGARLGLVSFLVAYFFGCSWLSLRKLETLGYAGQDLAYFSQIFYTTVHGRLFNSNFYQDLLYTRTVQSDFAGHNSPIQFVFAAFYWLRPNPSTLLIARNAIITLCAWPAYLLARRKFYAKLSAALAVMFVLIPAILFQNVFEFYPFSTAAFFLLFSFYFFERGELGFFLASLIVTLFVREDLVFAVFFFGLLALWQRRGWKWAMSPIVLAIFWAILSWKFVLPHFLQGAPFRSNVCFAQLGSSSAEMIQNVVHHPGTFLFTHNSFIYLKQLMVPYGGILSWASPVAAGSLPYLGINLLGGTGECPTTSLFSQHSVVPTVFLFVGFLWALESLRGLAPRFGVSSRRAAFIVAAFAFTLTLADLAFVTYPEQLEELRKQPFQDEARAVALLIPADAAVAAPRYLCPLLANRMSLYMTDDLLDYHHPDPEYVIIDRDWTRMRRTERWHPIYNRLVVALQAEPGMGVIYSSSNYVVFRRANRFSNLLQETTLLQTPHE